MSSSTSRPAPRSPLKHWLLLVVGVAVAVGAMVAASYRDASNAMLLDALEDARPARASSARFSLATEHRPCSVPLARKGELVPREACGDSDGQLARFEALAYAGESTDPDSLRASALLAILGGDQSEQAADTAIARLSRALRFSGGRPTKLLVDLSGAHFVRAQRAQSPLDLFTGLEYALEAVETEPHNAEAQFNAALLMQASGLDEQADSAWAAYLRIDSTGAWANEARERRRSLRHPPEPTRPKAGAPEEEVRAFALAHPQEARVYGWDTVLGDWGKAVLDGNAARAAELLRLAEWLGSELEARPGGDASLAALVRVIRSKAATPATTLALARAHRDFGEAIVLKDEQQHDSAQAAFTRAAGVSSTSPILAYEAEVYAAAMVIYQGKFAEAERSLNALRAPSDSARYPALVAHARWTKAGGFLRSKEYTKARAPYEAAAALYERAGETEASAAQWPMVGEVAHDTRDTLAAYRFMHRGLMSLRSYRSSVRLHNTLLTLGHWATLDGMPRAALLIQEEDVSVAARLPNPLLRMESLRERARLRWTRGEREKALEDLDRADSLSATISARLSRKWSRETLRVVRALVSRDTASGADLDAAIAYFSQNEQHAWLLPALLRRADDRIARRDLEHATTDLNTATVVIRDLSDGPDDAFLRVAMLEQARGTFDRLVMLHLQAGDTIAALRAVERGRVSFAPEYKADTLNVGPPAAPPGQVAVEYALVGDTLLAWVLDGRSVRLHRDTVSADSLRARIERSVAGLGSAEGVKRARRDYEHLYDLLVRPFKDSVRTGTPLVIIADGEIDGVPFDALRDSTTGRYLVEDHPLRSAPTLAEARRPAPPVDTSRSVLLVRDPAFDRVEYPALERLVGARAEVDSIRTVYPGGKVLGDSAATPDAFRDQAPHARVIHYAGHALFDDARPERSALVLAGRDTTGRLTAAAVSKLPLAGVRLVVLAACHTARSRQGRSGGMAGLSGALLAAGAGGVLGRVREADDRTTGTLMLAFHRALRSRDPAAALRKAQLEMLRSGEDEQSSPAAWAGFRYIGR